jgi:hypothetical protein
VTDTKLEPVAEKRRPPNAGKGRVKGVPNKTTRAVKEALWHAYEGVGGAEALKTWAEANPTEFYKLWGRMLPTEVSGPDGGPIVTESVVGVLEKLTPEERHGLREMAEKLEALVQP